MTGTDAWVIATGALAAGACALPGCFLILRRMAMLGDAISHAILPGIVVAFLLTESTSSLPIFLGAVLLGLATAFFVQLLSGSGVQGDAAIGVTFTSLFALGVVLLTKYAAGKDLDLDCVLFGEIAYVTMDPVGPFPRAFLINGGLLLLNAAFIRLCYKELKVCTFDPALAGAAGISVAGMHYALMAMVSITTVGAFESVGAILVVAMLIVPGATAYLLTDRLGKMLGISVAVGALSAVLGHAVSAWLGCSIAGAMASAAGVLFLLAFLFSPSHGIVSRGVVLHRLRRSVAEEDLLLWAIRRVEAGETRAFSPREASRGIERLPVEVGRLLGALARRDECRREGEGCLLTSRGEERARALLRRHRVYESYLGDLGYPTDHLHAAADRQEHLLTPVLTEAVDEAAHHPSVDPQGKPIPRP